MSDPMGECLSCGEGDPPNECPKSKRPCGHHCNHVWTHDGCDWCGHDNADGKTVQEQDPCPKCAMERRLAEGWAAAAPAPVSAVAGPEPDKGRAAAERVILDRLTAKSSHEYQWPRWAAAREAAEALAGAGLLAASEGGQLRLSIIALLGGGRDRERHTCQLSFDSADPGCAGCWVADLTRILRGDPPLLADGFTRGMCEPCSTVRCDLAGVKCPGPPPGDEGAARAAAIRAAFAPLRKGAQAEADRHIYSDYWRDGYVTALRHGLRAALSAVSGEHREGGR